MKQENRKRWSITTILEKKFSLELSKGLEGLRKDFKARKAAFDMRSIIDACKFLAIFYYKE